MVTQQKTQIKSRDTTDELSHKEFIEFLHARFFRYGDGHGVEKKGIALHFANGIVSGTNRSYIAR